MSCQTSCIANSVTFKEQHGTPQRAIRNGHKVYVGQDGVFRSIDDAGVVTLLVNDGTVTSVGVSSPGGITVGGSPIVGAGTITLTLHQDLIDFIANASYSGTTLITGGAIQVGGAGHVLGNFVVDGATQLTGNVLCPGDVVVNGTLTVDTVVAATLLNALTDLNVDGNADINGNLNAIGGVITFGGGNPIITFGTGVPAFVAPDGSIYLRSGSPNGSIYVRKNSVWTFVG